MMDLSTVNTITRKIKKDLNFKSLSPHMFRHTFATTTVTTGLNIESIRLLMGHQSIETTKIYFNINNVQLQSDALNHNPLAILKNKIQSR